MLYPLFKVNCLDTIWTGCGKIDYHFNDKIKEYLTVQICQIQLKLLHFLMFFMTLGVTYL